MRAFFDIDTQIDFLYAAGALYGAGGEHLIAPVSTLNHLAVRKGIPLISSTCNHPEDSHEFRVWPPHCVRGTVGQQKPGSLLFPNRVVVPNELANVNVRGVHQIILEKDDLDLFTNPNLLEVLQQLQIDECVVYGAFTEHCVRCAVNGLLRSGRRALLVTDAIAALDDRQGREVIDHFVASGGTLTTMSALLNA